MMRCWHVTARRDGADPARDRIAASTLVLEFLMLSPARGVPGYGRCWGRRSTRGHARRTLLGGAVPQVSRPSREEPGRGASGLSILIIADQLLRNGTDEYDLGHCSCDERDRRAVERRLVHRLESLGGTVSLQPAAQTTEGERCFQTRLDRFCNKRGASHSLTRDGCVVGDAAVAVESSRDPL
jgi:hypothetical protein